jgi:hypothetical protein
MTALKQAYKSLDREQTALLQLQEKLPLPIAMPNVKTICLCVLLILSSSYYLTLFIHLLYYFSFSSVFTFLDTAAENVNLRVDTLCER